MADLLPKWNARDPQSAWAVYHANLSNAFARITHDAGRAARVRKDDHGPLSSTDRAPEITIPINPYAAKWVHGHAGELCVDLSQRQHGLVRGVVQRMYEQGRRPEEIAEHLRNVVGLTDRQEQAVWSYQQRLIESGDYDEDEAAGLGAKYAARQLVYRTENIARTESHNAVEQGRRCEWLEARDDGEIPATTKRAWVSAPASARLCDLCVAMDGQEVGLDDDFYCEELGIYVSSPTLHPSCRCTVRLVV